MKKIGILTSGGDAPGMNAAIRAITKTAIHYGIQPIGVLDGFEGLMNGWFKNMNYEDVDNIIQRGGTVLGSARAPKFKEKEARKEAIEHLEKAEIEGLIVIGGDGSFTGAHVLSSEMNIPVIGIPGTIDNDLYGTETTIGYDTALNTIVEAIDKIRDTATSHKRIFFVEVMGRNSGFLALNSAIASGAESVLIPETISDIEAIALQIKNQNKGRRSSIIIVAEGDEEGGAMDIMRKVKPHLKDYELRTTILGHIQRGGSPSFYDRSLATRSGIKAVELLMEGNTKKMIGIKSDELVTIDLKDAIDKNAFPKIEKEELLAKLLTK
ncbi:6-phosphofructokinase [Brumimicrobium aurantiacum]|uniref:ATP-dependent 6-phosphofructokinase n=1 Tax=Brumimicrobium aurantiacum TaxID=1737063 RepID=A0A3E1EVY3_9FLAO|nr:6-phosphofructokinase [Brumimicrobium aurantiacum]RFC53682.1 6-phosphofructokinase [Brumimicrobium aurantiacum]